MPSAPSSFDWRLAARAVALVVLSAAMWHYWVRPTLATRSGAQLKPPAAPVGLDEFHVMGSPNATVGLLIFGDFQCPACGVLERGALRTINQDFVRNGSVVLAFGDVPLERIHPTALERSAVAECAGRQGRFWETHDRLFANQAKAPDDPMFVGDLNSEALRSCLSGNAYQTVRLRAARAQALGISETPTVFIGTVDAGHHAMHVLDVVVGVHPSADMSRKIGAVLKSAGRD